MASEDPPQEAALAPYVIEGARSSRSRCKSCRRAIEKGTLRIGFLIEGPYGTGYLWHHLRCAARRQFGRVEEAYAQEAWTAAKQPPDRVPALDELRKLREAAEEQRRVRKTIPYAEPAPTARSKCKHCEQPIEKGTLRVILGRGVYFGSQVRTSPINVHPRCVAAELRAEDCLTEVGGFVEALRANSTDVEAERIEALLGEIGPLD